MGKTAASDVLAPRQLRAARRELLETGRLGDGALSECLGRSWLRSRDFGLSPVGRAPGAPHASAAQLRRALERQHELVAHARPVMDDLFEQTRDGDALVVLADARGLLLRALGDGRFVDRAERVALRPGAIWDERWRGTNAIGTALAEQRPVSVLGGEHFLERNGFLSCTAAPIRDPQGRILGVLDLSGDQRGFQRHTLALVRSAARMVEHRLFETRHADGLRLHLHLQPEGLGTPTEGLLAVSEDGWVLGCNAAAQAWLGADAARPCRLEHLLPVPVAELLARAHDGDARPRVCRRDTSAALWWRVQSPPGWRDRTSVAAGSAAVAHAAAAARPVLSTSTSTSTSTTPCPAAVAPAEALDAFSPLDLGDAAMRRAIDRARRLRDQSIPILLQGESGVGKDLFARAVHDASARRAGPFVAVNCAALPEALIEAELFGYRGGAFTGASRDGAPGRLREAHGGTLFLDEIGDMPLALQARLLRVLQDRQVRPLGGGAVVTVDLQLVCASHQPLRRLVAEGRFREDLYYRVNGLSLQLPPLRERDDLPRLVQRLLDELAPGRGLQLDDALMRACATYRWPGNIRQLQQALRIACALLAPGETVIRSGHLPDDLLEEFEAMAAPAPGAQDDDAWPVARAGQVTMASSPSGSPSDDADTMTRPPAVALREQARLHARRVLSDCDGNRSEAARRLGIGRNTLYRLLG